MSSMNEIERRFRVFIEVGYRPQLKSHLLPGEPREGWATLYWREFIGDEFLSDMHSDSIGWSIDAWSVQPKGQNIIGGVFSTIEEALFYAEKELDKILGNRKD